MLPGFRFLFAAIVLTMSILVFGLGAAALLRTAHEEFAANPSWRVPEPRFARQDEAPIPVLAILRLEPDPSEQKPSDGVAAAGPAEPPSIAAVPTEPEKVAALNPQDSSPPQAAKPEIPAAEPPAQGASAPASADETRIAAVALPPTDDAPVPEQATAPAAAEADVAAPKIATLGDPPVAIEAEASAKAAGAKPDPSVVKKRQQARRAAQRRRVAQRARLARQVAAQQQAADPFAQPATNIRSR